MLDGEFADRQRSRGYPLHADPPIVWVTLTAQPDGGEDCGMIREPLSVIRHAMLGHAKGPITAVAFSAALWLTTAPMVMAQQFPMIPDDRLTPGEVVETNSAVICQPGHSRMVRHTSGRMKHDVYRRYGIDRRSGHFEIDHRVPLGLGGADTEENLWPESYDTQPWNAHLKDRLENHLHELVCDGEMSLSDAQAAFLGDWTAAYERFLGEP